MKAPEAIAALAFEYDIDDDTLIADAIVLLRCIDPADGGESLVIATSDGLSGYTQVAMLHAAIAIGDDYRESE